MACESDTFPMLTEVIYTCGICSTSGMNTAQYFTHMSKAHGIKYFCGLCDAGKTQPRQLLAHHALSHPSSEIRIRMFQGNELQDVVPETIQGWQVARKKSTRTKQNTAAQYGSPRPTRQSAAMQVKGNDSTLNEGSPMKKARKEIGTGSLQLQEAQDAQIAAAPAKAHFPNCTPKQDRSEFTRATRVIRWAKQTLTIFDGLELGSHLELTECKATAVQVPKQNSDAPLPPLPKQEPPVHRSPRRQARAKSQQAENDKTHQCVQELDDEPICIFETDLQFPGLKTGKNSMALLDGVSSSQPSDADVRPRMEQSRVQRYRCLSELPSSRPKQSVGKPIAEQCEQVQEAAAPRSRGQIDKASAVPCLRTGTSKFDHVIILPVYGQDLEITPRPRVRTEVTVGKTEVITLDDDNEQTEGFQGNVLCSGRGRSAPETCMPQVESTSGPDFKVQSYPQPYSFYGQSVEPIPLYKVRICLRNSDIKVSYQQLADVMPLQPVVLMRRLTFHFPYV